MPLVGQVGFEPTIALSTGLTVRGGTSYTVLTHMAERAELESDTETSVRSAKPAVPGPPRFTLHILNLGGNITSPCFRKSRFHLLVSPASARSLGTALSLRSRLFCTADIPWPFVQAKNPERGSFLCSRKPKNDVV